MELTVTNVKLIGSEIQIMSACSHPNIVQYYSSHRVDKELWMVMEYLGGGCLTEILEQFEDVQMNESQIAWVCKQVLQGLQFIHSKHRIHRDIKSDNILLGVEGEVKIGTHSHGAYRHNLTFVLSHQPILDMPLS